jgi:ABC-type sugar transport system permease subunit
MSVSKTVVLLILYYVLCFVIGGGFRLALTKPWAGWGIWDYAWFVCPALGLFYALIWVPYFRQPAMIEGQPHLGNS